MPFVLLLSLDVDLFSFDLFLLLSLFFLIVEFLGGFISMLFEVALGLQVEDFSVNLVGLGEDSLELFETFKRILLQLNVESEPCLVFRLSFRSLGLVSILLPGSDLRADVLSFIIG